MIAAAILFLLSLAGLAIAFALPGWSDLVLLAGPCALASLILLLLAWRRRGKDVAQRRPSAPKWIVIDGSNVMHWKDNTPRIETLREVIEYLANRGFTPGVVLDANAGYLVAGRYQHHAAFGQLLGLPEDRVMVVSKGTPADTTVLAAARDLGARIVTNDRYRDWAELHPEVKTPGHLIRGGYRNNQLWLEIAEADAER